MSSDCFVMEEQNTLQEPVDEVPRSSSPASTAGSNGGAIACNRSSPVSSPTPDLPRGNLLAKYTRLEGKPEEVCSNPLLSPFAVVKTQEKLDKDIIESQSTPFQHALESFSISPEVSMLSSVASDASPPVADVLQSPFGVSAKATSSLSNDLFLSSSPRTKSPVADRSTSGATVERGAFFEDRARRNVNDLSDSDSGESMVTADVPTTPRSPKFAIQNSLSSPYFVMEHAEKHINEKEAICVEMTVDDRHSQSPGCDKQLQTPDQPTKLLQVKHEVLSDSMTACSSSFENKFNMKSTEESLSNVILSATTDYNALNKRTRDADDKHSAPAPKRMTLATQQKQHKKLASPFRSPLVTRSNPGSTGIPLRAHMRARTQPAGQICAVERSFPPKNSLLPASVPVPRPRTPSSISTKAKSQFKSPLMSSTSVASPSGVSKTRTIQELERKAQLLKRAIKIKKENEEETLERLVKKWRAAGREAAWELWQFVRDNEQTSGAAPYPGTNAQSSRDSFSSGWGWADTAQSAGSSNWGWDQTPEKESCEDDVQSEELESPTKLERELFDTLRRRSGITRTTMLPPTPRGAYFNQRSAEPECENSEEEHKTDDGNSQSEEPAEHQSKTLGTMLHQLGIAHETLGWVEDEGDFVDA